MNRYVALLRGINVGGKNKIAMSELKNGFEKLGFTSIVTYLNSGNVVFSSNYEETVLSNKIGLMIKSKFDLEIPVFIVLQEDLKEQLNAAPDWWGDDSKEIYDRLIRQTLMLIYFYSTTRLRAAIISENQYMTNAPQPPTDHMMI